MNRDKGEVLGLSPLRVGAPGVFHNSLIDVRQTGRFRQMSNVDLRLEVYFMKHSRHPLEVILRKGV